MQDKFLLTSCIEQWTRKGLVKEMTFGVKKRQGFKKWHLRAWEAGEMVSGVGALQS